MEAFSFYHQKYFQFVEGDNTSWENGPLSELAGLDQLRAYKHHGFWQPMDTLREKIYFKSFGILGMHHGKLGKSKF